MTYQMLDSGTGIQQGEAPASDGGAGSSSLSSHFVFKQTYSVKNLTGGTLSGVQLYQFLHGLESGKSIYDDRDYGGTFGGYRFDNTQIGEDLSFHTETNEVFSHLDTIAMHAQNMPSSHEVGYFGKEGVDDHRNGKPSVGVHLSVEAKALSGEDFFEPPEGRWVSGAMCFDLPDLLPGASAERDVLLSLSTVSTLRFPAPDIHIFTSEFNGDGDFVLEFEDRKEVPVDGYILFKSTDLSGPFPDAWTQLALPRLIDAPHPGASRFTIPIDPGSKRCFFVIQPVFDD